MDDVGGLGRGRASASRLWLHVDAAYGGAARLSPRDAHRVPGLERADSVTVDPHKWFFQAYDIGALVVRRREDLLRTFHAAPEYYRSHRPEDEPLDWYQYSMEGTRRFRALKLWMSWKHLGTEGLGPPDRAQRRPRRLPRRAPWRADPDFEAMPADARAVRRVLPPPARRRRGWRPDAVDELPGAVCSARWRSAARRG